VIITYPIKGDKCEKIPKVYAGQ